jgi:hypothetical protein
MDQVAARRRLVETATRLSGRLQMAVREGVELAAKMFQPQLLQVEGITEDEIKLLHERLKMSNRREKAKRENRFVWE